MHAHARVGQYTVRDRALEITLQTSAWRLAVLGSISYAVLDIRAGAPHARNNLADFAGRR